eukprot:SAG31_NODE_10958_length_1079_cov_0.894898_1_plen_98_part_10
MAWIARGVGGCSNATAALATSIVSGDSGLTRDSTDSTAQSIVVVPGHPVVLTHTVVSSLDLGKRTGPCSWDWRDPVPVAVAAAVAMDVARAKSIEAQS